MKKLLPFLAFGSLLVTIGLVLDSYAIFETDVKVKTETPLADWQIKINGSNLNAVTNTFNINTVNWETSGYVLPGKASPGLSAFFEILIDPTGSQVSMQYEISLDFAALDNEMIQFVSIKDGSGTPLTESTPGVYSGVILLADVLLGNVETIRVDLNWINDEGNNAVDSGTVNQADVEINIPVSIKVSQYLE